MSDTSSRDYPRLYLESDYGQRTDRENDLDTDLERVERERGRASNRSVTTTQPRQQTKLNTISILGLCSAVL